MLGFFFVLLLVLAALRPFAVPDEGRYGEIGRWMWISGDWLTPRLNGVPFFHKPPLLYWLEALSVGLLGVSEWSLRLIPALHAGLMLLTLYAAVRHWADAALARRSVIMLGSSLGFLVGGQYVNHDMMVATWISVAIGCFAMAFLAGERAHRGWALAGFAACGLGMLSKGLIGFVLPGLVLAVWLSWTRQWRKAWSLPWLSGLALFAAIALPWFVAAQARYPGFFDYMFIGQQFHRYTAQGYNNPQPWWFYALALVLLLFPWVFFAGRAMRHVTDTTLARALRPSAAVWSLCWIWVGAITVFFSIPNSKLVGYILPVLPPLCVLAALGWERSLGARPSGARWFAGLVALNLAIALALVLTVGKVTRASRTQDVAAVLACAARPHDTIWVADGFPYDLPLYAQTTRPLRVVADWSALRQSAGDGWQRELFEGADFDAQAAQVLQPVAALAQAAHQPGQWYLGRKGAPIPGQAADAASPWRLAYRGFGWDLYQSQPEGHADSAPKGPETAEHIGLPGCKDQRHSQREPARPAQATQ
ncbi:MAG: glycosyltransferase family 39 protein [Rhodoferax sp.]